MEREFEAATLRRQDDAERDLFVAWHTAVFAMQAFNGKLTDFRTIVGRAPKESKRQSIAEQRRVLMVLSEQYGIPLREVVH